MTDQVDAPDRWELSDEEALGLLHSELDPALVHLLRHWRETGSLGDFTYMGLSIRRLLVLPPRHPLVAIKTMNDLLRDPRSHFPVVAPVGGRLAIYAPDAGWGRQNIEQVELSSLTRGLAKLLSDEVGRARLPAKHTQRLRQELVGLLDLNEIGLLEGVVEKLRYRAEEISTNHTEDAGLREGSAFLACLQLLIRLVEADLQIAQGAT